MEDDILTIKEVAKYLRVSDRTVYDWAQKGMIPAGKIGTAWRFKRTEIEKWMNEKLSSPAQKENEVQKIIVKNILSPDRILFIDHITKQDALIALSNNLGSAPQIKDKLELTQEILKREELMSTAIGRGIAIPHVRLSSVTDLVMSVGICQNDIIDFQAIDDVPVRILIMIAASKEQHKYYLQTLSFFSGKLKKNEVRSALLSSKNEQEAYKILTEGE